MARVAQVVQYHNYGYGKGLVNISERIGRRMRELNKRLAAWPTYYIGYGDDARKWAARDMADLLRHMADDLECNVPDSEIGARKAVTA